MRAHNNKFRVMILVISGLLYQPETAQSSPKVYDSVEGALLDFFATKRLESLNPLKNYRLPHLFRGENNGRGYDSGEVCALCNLVVSLVLNERALGAPRDILFEEVVAICDAFNLETSRVCSGAVSMHIDTFLYIMDNKSNLTSERVCGSVLQNIGCESSDFEWSIDLPPGVSKERPQLDNPSEGSFQILQLSDIHYDPYYLPQGNAACGEPICCQSDQGDPRSPEDSCGFWTDYRLSDVPWHLIEEVITQVVSENHFDYVYYTGDVVSHRVWETSRENNSRDISRLYDYFGSNFPVPVFPIFGNHEPHPINAWPSVDDVDGALSTRWLLELAAALWEPWLGREAAATILKGGYYTVTPRPGFRIVGLNTNVCYTDNWWLIYSDEDPFGQLKWLVEILAAAEIRDESVHILGHVPTGSASCLKVWSREYRRIVERFSNVITGQFNGHTHEDEFHVYYNRSEPLGAIGVAFNGASVTPYSNSNPSYKLYRVDDDTYTLLDYEEWTFNLTLANSNPGDKPNWYKLYSFVETYGVGNLQAKEVAKVPLEMAGNHSLLDDYYRFKYRNGDAGLKIPCEDSCKRELLCDIVTAQYGDDTQCRYFLDIYDR